jgi:hypothetical protein
MTSPRGTPNLRHAVTFPGLELALGEGAEPVRVLGLRPVGTALHGTQLTRLWPFAAGTHHRPADAVPGVPVGTCHSSVGFVKGGRMLTPGRRMNLDPLTWG